MQRLLIQLVNMAFEVYYWLIIGRVILSWVQIDPNNPIIEFIFSITEPVLAPLRRLIPMGNMRIDFTPIIALLLISFLRRFVIRALYSLLYF